MIVFDGDVTSEKALRSHGRRARIVFVLVMLITIVFQLPMWSFFLTRITLIAATLGGIVIFICIPNTLWAHIPEKIVIDREKRTITAHLTGYPVGFGFREAIKSFDKVSKVVDRGDYYGFYFGGRFESFRFVAQKDLISEGTIEEFEEIFKDVLVRE